MLCLGKPYLLHNDTTSSDELISWISHAETGKFPRKEKALMAFHFLSKTPPSQLWLRHRFSKANNSSGCILGSIRWLCFLGWQRFEGAVERLIQTGRALHTRWGSHMKSWSLLPRMFHWHLLWKCSKYILSFCVTKLNLISITQCGTCCAPVLFAVRQELSCSSCLSEKTAFPTLTEILTLSQMPHAIISEKFRELTSATSFYHLSPSYSLTCFSGSKKPLIFILLVSNKSGTNGSWQNMFSVSAENLSAWCPWNAQCD